METVEYGVCVGDMKCGRHDPMNPVELDKHFLCHHGLFLVGSSCSLISSPYLSPTSSLVPPFPYPFPSAYRS